MNSKTALSYLRQADADGDLRAGLNQDSLSGSGSVDGPSFAANLRPLLGALAANKRTFVCAA